MSLVDICGLRKSYNHSIASKVAGNREYPVLKGIDFKVEKGDFICIMGQSGCGKTTLLKIIGTIDKPTKGKVSYEGIDVRKLNTDQLAELRKNRIGFVFQEFNLMNNLSVEENIMIPLVLNKAKHKDMRAVVDKNVSLLGISGLLKKYPYELSGGEKQRVAIARALSNDPDILLADEPTGNLDSVSAEKIMKYFTEINYRKKKAVVVVTHDPVVASYARKILVIKDGKITKQIENNLRRGI